MTTDYNKTDGLSSTIGSYLTTYYAKSPINMRRANTCDPALKLFNEEIISHIQKHKQNIWKEQLITTTPRHIANCFTTHCQTRNTHEKQIH